MMQIKERVRYEMNIHSLILIKILFDDEPLNEQQLRRFSEQKDKNPRNFYFLY